jgi:hypothetical protein
LAASYCIHFSFLLAAISKRILGYDFLVKFCLLLGPSFGVLDAASMKSLATPYIPGFLSFSAAFCSIDVSPPWFLQTGACVHCLLHCGIG